MKIVVTAENGGLEAAVDPRFGRASCFLLFDTETGTHHVHVNDQNLNATQGAGVQAAQAVARLGAEVVLTGHVGPKAFQTLSAAGIPVVTGAIGTVRQAIDLWKTGELAPANSPDMEGHWT